MKWNRARRSKNVEDRRGSGGMRAAGGLGLGDIEAALNTASAIGDDRLQRQAQGTIVPDAFTHGTSAQRVRWFRTGFDNGDPAGCDTFTASQL